METVHVQLKDHHSKYHGCLKQKHIASISLLSFPQQPNAKSESHIGSCSCFSDTQF